MRCRPTSPSERLAELNEQHAFLVERLGCWSHDQPEYPIGLRLLQACRAERTTLLDGLGQISQDVSPTHNIPLFGRPA